MQTTHPDRSAWHDGELAVRERVGVELAGNGLHSSIAEGAAQFLAEQRLAVFASIDDEGRTWASLRMGEPGFVRASDSATIETEPLTLDGDPLIANLKQNPDVGFLVLNPATRRRMRVNGTAQVLEDESLRIHAQQVYGNCQQYIQERVLGGATVPNPPAGTASRGTELNPEQQKWIAHADTFFIASAHPENGADASHRGGNSGFINVVSARKFIIPDYHGNMMFNTLGNIEINPRVGLVFPDFERGRTLQLTGRATIDWDSDRKAYPGAERLLLFEIEQTIEIEQPALRGYVFKSYSRFNPK